MQLTQTINILVSAKDKILISGLQQGDPLMFEEFFNEFFSALCSYSKLIVKRSDVAEDIVQELFYKIWNKREELNFSTSVKSYLFRSVYNNSIEFLRSEKLEGAYKEFNVRELEFDDTDELNPELIAKLNKAIDELPDKCREVYKLRKLHNLSHAEIAEQLNISKKTVETHVHRAHLALKEKMKNISLVLIVYLFIHPL